MPKAHLLKFRRLEGATWRIGEEMAKREIKEIAISDSEAKKLDAAAAVLDEIRDRLIADDETCPDCRHAKHPKGFCPNMASDNDCDCKGGG